MSESVFPPSDSLPDQLELALRVRTIWRAMPAIGWSPDSLDRKAVPKVDVEHGYQLLGLALVGAAGLMLHCVDSRKFKTELRLIYDAIAAVSAETKPIAWFMDTLRCAVDVALGDSESKLSASLVAMPDTQIQFDSPELQERAWLVEHLDEPMQAFLERPLVAPESLAQADDEDLLANWRQALTAAGFSGWWVVFNEWQQGSGLDWARLKTLVHDWTESRLLEKVEPHGNTETRHGNATVEQTGPEVDGGIVTAAADEPCVDDHLGRKPLVDTLADMLASPEQPLPMTIALLGAWGAGKSSVILQLRKRLTESNQHEDRAHYHFAEFNAWEYEHTDNIRAGLAHEVVRGLTAGMGWWQKMRLALSNAHRQRPLELYGQLAVMVIGGLGLWLGLWLGLTTGKGTSGAVGGLGFIGLGGWLAVNAFRNGQRMLAHPLAGQLKTYLQLPAYGKHLGEVPVIRQEIAGLCAARLGEQTGAGVVQRLLVVVDDLDRCQPECITACLDAVRLVMSLPHVAVIIAVDDRIAFQAVAAHYAGLAKDGSRSKEAIARDYLGKIIQLPVNLYPPWPQEVSAFVSQHLFKLNEPGGQIEAGRQPAGQSAAAGSNTATGYGQPGINHSLEAGTGMDAGISAADPAADQQVDAQTAAPERARQATPDQQDECVRQSQMQDHLFEQELFIELAELAQFSNPRQLIRLRNGYRLLKGYTLNRRGNRSMARQDCERLLLGLFWYEYLYQCELTERREQELLAWEWFEPLGLDDAAKSRADDRRLRAAESSRAMVKQLAQCLGEQNWYTSYPNMLRTVQMAVLPNADLGLLMTEEEATAAAADGE